MTFLALVVGGLLEVFIVRFWTQVVDLLSNK